MGGLFDTISPYMRLAKYTAKAYTGRAFVDPDYVLTYIPAGRGRFIFDQSRYEVSKGDLILMPPYFMHILETVPDEELHQYVIQLDLFTTPDRIGSIPRDPNLTYESWAQNKENPETLLAHVPPVARPPEIHQAAVLNACETLLECYENGDGSPSMQLMVKARLLDLLRIYLDSVDQQEAPTMGTDRAFTKGWRNLEKAIAYTHAHYADPITTEEVSDVAGLSVAYFCHLFKRYTRRTFRQYLQEYRISQAKTLIQEGDMNFSQIAAAVGFSSIQRFSKVFRQHEGVTPTVYSRQRTLTCFLGEFGLDRSQNGLVY